MAARPKKALGKGLKALLSENQKKSSAANAEAENAVKADNAAENVAQNVVENVEEGGGPQQDAAKAPSVDTADTAVGAGDFAPLSTEGTADLSDDLMASPDSVPGEVAPMPVFESHTEKAAGENPGNSGNSDNPDNPDNPGIEEAVASTEASSENQQDQAAAVDAGDAGGETQQTIAADEATSGDFSENTEIPEDAGAPDGEGTAAGDEGALVHGEVSGDDGATADASEISAEPEVVPESEIASGDPENPDISETQSGDDQALEAQEEHAAQEEDAAHEEDAGADEQIEPAGVKESLEDAQPSELSTAQSPSPDSPDAADLPEDTAGEDLPADDSAALAQENPAQENLAQENNDAAGSDSAINGINEEPAFEEAPAAVSEAGADDKADDKDAGDSPEAAPAAEELAAKDGLVSIEIDKLVASRFQPRRVFDEERLSELAQSIREQGLLEPLLVRRQGADRYEIICGERRYRACRKAGLKQVPCLIRDVLDTNAYAIALTENLQREDLNPVEQAMAMSNMLVECGLTQDELARSLGKPRSTVTNILRLNNLQESVKDLLAQGALETGHAKVLLSIDGELQSQAAAYVVKKELTIRQTEALVKQLKETGRFSGVKPKTERDPNFDSWERQLNDKLGGVSAHLRSRAGGQGRLILTYTTEDQLKSLMEIFGVS